MFFREYLTGFRKRNQEKRQKKKEEFEIKLKEEKKRIKTEAKEAFKSLLPKRKVLPDLDDLKNEEIDYGTHTVKIAEFTPNKLAEENNFIGENTVSSIYSCITKMKLNIKNYFRFNMSQMKVMIMKA